MRDETSERQAARLEEIGTALTLEKICEEFTSAARLFEARVGALLEKDRPAGAPFIGLRSVLRRGRETFDRIEHWLEHGRSDVDAFVASVLRGEDKT